MRVLAPITLAAALTFTLTGCFGNPVENLVEGAIEQQTGVDVDVNSDGSGASLPADWPSDVPTPAGTVVASFGVDGTYSATIEMADAAAAQAGLDALLAAGYESQSQADLGGMKMNVLTNGTWGVTYSWGEDGDGNTVLNMAVTPAPQ
ncbi:hypothetical protein M2152_002185 [Microbacteriaceae bacterium SG_E_30_P1]|uniref:Lipoprotein n=1 Tax=Antiquaquibacter oligotrophicus TaxID=2880260 RepID=A0ABT6KR94_9MICO|nr:hypothetical protein [Antiquaquibacter oligotrophicus]MDH6182003.1 hypothetical protein [Antiquaquibacter oligotrophicus]UDF12329.1 hypothetical protein LH407_09145 [Antiquaquibacter oligotrophicus]